MVFPQRRTLTISELEGKGELEASISKQVDSLETEMELRSATHQPQQILR